MKNLSFIISLLLFSSLLEVKAQLTTGEKPISLDLRNRTDLEKLSPIRLEPPDLQRVSEEDKIMNELYRIARFAYPVMTNFNLENSGHWTTFDDGSKLWRLDLVIPGALSTHTIYDKFWLPDGAKFFVYNEKTESFIGAVTSEFIVGTFENPRSYSTGILLGKNITYEYYQPATVKETPIIEISRIDYGYRFLNHIIDAVRPSKKNGDSFQNPDYTGFDACSCHVNVNCPEGNNWQNEKNAVARIMRVFPNHPQGSAGSYWCTGALVNNTRNDYTPYFLTADHCLEYVFYKFDAIPTGNFSSNYIQHWIFYWNFEWQHSQLQFVNGGCANPLNPYRPANSGRKSTRGATVIANANTSASDFALLKLEEDPRALINKGVTLYYLGWDATGNTGVGGVCIHHPAGDVKKISTYDMTPVSVNVSGTLNTNGNYWSVKWIETFNGRHGVTQGFSSGAPLINNAHRVIGQLYGGRSACGDDTPNLQGVLYGKNQPDRFGKFSVSWDANPIPQRQLKHWLAPAPSTATVLNGIPFVNNCNLINLAGPEPPANETNKLVICRTINVQNVTVPAGKRLNLISTDRIIINGITVNPGASLMLETPNNGSITIDAGFTIQEGAAFVIW